MCRCAHHSIVCVYVCSPAARDGPELRDLVRWLRTLKCKVFDGLTTEKLFELAENIRYKFLGPGITGTEPHSELCVVCLVLILVLICVLLLLSV